MRLNARENHQLRALKVTPHFLKPNDHSILFTQDQIKFVVNSSPAEQLELNIVAPETFDEATVVSELKRVLGTITGRYLSTPLKTRFEITILSTDRFQIPALINGILIDLILFGQLSANDKQLLLDLSAISVGLNADDDTFIDLDRADEIVAELNLLGTEDDQIIDLTMCGNINGGELNLLLQAASQGREMMHQQILTAIGPWLDRRAVNEEKTVVIATKNPGKVKEFKQMFAKEGIRVKSLADYPDLPEIDETGRTFEENARLKADQIAKLLNLPVLADDSGLMVDALDGKPGIYSARYSGQAHNDAANNAKLLFELTDVPPEKRTADFHTTLVFAKPNQSQDDLVVNGDLKGKILGIPRGNDGFGYDPLFFVPEKDKTLAEMTTAEKNEISHRGRAIENLAPIWKQWLNKTETNVESRDD